MSECCPSGACEVCNRGIGTNAECPHCRQFHFPQCLDCGERAPECGESAGDTPESAGRYVCTTSPGGAREAVARKLFDVYADELGHADAEWDDEGPMSQDDWCRDADSVLAALAPIIAAEIRATAEAHARAWQHVSDQFSDGVRAEARMMITGADGIASRICGGGE